MSRRNRAAVTCAALAAFATAATAAGAATSTSTNWAGYAVTAAQPATPASGATTTFTRVSGSWIQPAVTCVGGTPNYSSFWVGLGGNSESSQGLEQLGTEADCSVSNRASYSMWYELLPAAPVDIRLRVRPGDTISAGVTVTGQTVSLRIRNVTRKTLFTKTLFMATPDVSSAEWIAEAPSTCDRFDSCTPLPLANFGTVRFKSAVATANGHSGTIADTAWSATAIQLQDDKGRFADARAATQAVPTNLFPDGASFAVTWQQASPTAGG